MKVAYFDCFAGASGDMILGSLLDAGLDLELLKQEIAKLGLTHYDIDVNKVSKRGIGGSQALVQIDEDHHHHHHRHLHDIKEIIEGSSLAESVRKRSVAIFTRLAEAEAHVHQTRVENIHFHEVGAMDAIIDVVGSVAGLAAFGIEKIFCSPLHVGSGTVECAHGILPVPAPATAKLIEGRPVYSTGVRGELLTPTGAAILTTLADDFGPMPPMIVERLGYGAGSSDPSIPNLLRLMVGEATEAYGGYEFERIAVAETNIDDMNPQMYDYLIDRMFAMGALDVFLVPVRMKKNRPGTVFTVICPQNLIPVVADFLMKETTTIGVRWRIDNRLQAEREIREIQTAFGPVKFKVARMGDRIVNVAPEYDDCRRVAREKNIPLKEIMDAARAAARDLGDCGIA